MRKTNVTCSGYWLASSSATNEYANDQLRVTRLSTPSYAFLFSFDCWTLICYHSHGRILVSKWVTISRNIYLCSDRRPFASSSRQ